MEKTTGIPSSVLHRTDIPSQSSMTPDPRSSHPSVRQPFSSSSLSNPQARPCSSQPYARQPPQSRPPPQNAPNSYPQQPPQLQLQYPYSHSRANAQEKPIGQSAQRARAPVSNEPHTQRGQVVPYEANLSRPHPATPLLAPLISALDAHASGLTRALEERDARIASLEHQLSRTQHDAQACMTFENKCTTLEYKCNTLETTRTTLESKCTTLENRCAAYVVKCATLENTRAALSDKYKECTALMDKYSTLETTHSTLEAQCATLETSHTKLTEKYSTLENEYSDLENKHSALKTKNLALEAHCTALETRHADHSVACAAKEHERDTLLARCEARLALLEGHHAGCADRERALVEQREEIEGQQREIEGQRAEIERLRSTPAPTPSAAAGGTWVALVSVQTENARLRALLAGSSEPRAWTSTFARVTPEGEDEDELEDDEEFMLREEDPKGEDLPKKVLESATKDFKDAENDLETAKRDLNALKTDASKELETASRARAGLEARIWELVARVEGLEGERSALLRERDEERERLAANNTHWGLESARLGSENAQLKMDDARLRSDNARLGSDNTQLRSDSARLSAGARCGAEELARVRAAVEEEREMFVEKKRRLEADNKRLEDERRQLEDEKQQLEGEMRELETRVARQLAGAEDALAEARKEMQRLDEEKRRLEAESAQHPSIRTDRRLVAANRMNEDLRTDNLHAVRQLLEAESALLEAREEVQRVEDESRARAAEHAAERERLVRQLEARRREDAEEGEISDGAQGQPVHVAVQPLPPSSPPPQPISSAASSPSPSHARSPALPRMLSPFMLGAAPASPPRSSSPAAIQRKAHPSLPPHPGPWAASVPSPRKRSRAAYEAESADIGSARPAVKTRVSLNPMTNSAPKKARKANANAQRTPLGVLNGNSTGDAPRKLGISHLGLLYETVGDRMRCRMCLPGTHSGIAAAAPWGELVGHALTAHADECAELLKLGPAQVVEKRQRMGLGF
ncbi:hypothetical protein FB451DRAFT_1230126 [Mycena latifolia]|nr:hypothetical protein FB451DRAFT_1230126 [Mycena latifolia]